MIWAAVFGICAVSLPVLGQEGPGDQRLRFGFGQKFGATDNIRLQEDSVGTTYFSDTTLSFGFSNEAGLHALDFSAEGVGRIVNDPVIGTDSDFRDPRVDLTYRLDGANSRLDFDLRYFKPDLAFNDPLRQAEIRDQDLSTGGGTREDFDATVRFETGLQAPLGFYAEATGRRRSFSDTDDPLLFSNRTNEAGAGLIFRFSGVTRGRVDAFERRYRAEDTRGNETDTRRFTFGLDHDFSPTDTLSVDLGHSKVVETFAALPGFEDNTSGPVATVAYTREVPDGAASAELDTFLTSRGRQSTLEFGRVFDLPNGGLEFTFGATRGDSFEVRPIGSLSYVNELPRGHFNIGLSRTSSISDTLSQATETSQLDMGYRHDMTALSSLGLTLNYADITLVGNNSGGAGRERASFNAYYSHNVTEDWDFVLGYEYRYFNPDNDASANSNGVFFSIQRDLDIFR